VAKKDDNDLMGNDGQCIKSPIATAASRTKIRHPWRADGVPRQLVENGSHILLLTYPSFVHSKPCKKA
jgi:hypothetical protein